MTASMSDLSGRTAAVTGGSRGLGLEIARALSHAGATVVIGGRDADSIEKAADQLSELGSGRVVGLPLNVRDEQSVNLFFEQAFAISGRLDVLVNNAGIQVSAYAAEATAGQWQEIFETNLLGAFLCCQKFFAATSGSRSIVNISSLAASVGIASQSAYASAKAGLEALTRTLAVEWARYDVRVNAIAPGYFATAMPLEVLSEDAAEKIVRRVPMRRMGEPFEIGGLVLYLASSASAYMTGATLTIDGGYTAQ
ncbi:MAG: 3-oxoacyl-ACP reductase [Frankiales bacterium]|nr:3-oxoacyl-ACP reductase [Frankiales bacterium]